MVADTLARGEIPDGIDSAEHALLDWCGLMTLRPSENTASHVEAVRRAGWSDEQIAEAVYVTAMFAFFNRIADAFGLDDPGYGAMGEGAMGEGAMGEGAMGEAGIVPATRFAPSEPPSSSGVDGAHADPVESPSDPPSPDQPS